MRHDLRGAAALAFGIICAGLAGSALYLWSHLDLYQNDLPALTAAGHGRTIYFYPWAASLGSTGCALAALWLLVRSVHRRCAAGRSWLTFLHLGTLLTLLPLLFHLLYSAGTVLRR